MQIRRPAVLIYLIRPSPHVTVLKYFVCGVFPPVCVCMSTREVQFLMCFGRPTNWYVTTSSLRCFSSLTVRLFGSMHASLSPLSVDLLGRFLMSFERRFVTCRCTCSCRWDVALFVSSEPRTFSIFVFAINGHRPSFSPECFTWVTLAFDTHSHQFTIWRL